ncbi:MAG: ATP-binding cassette domain-containing protein [Gemmatimonadota bacterium]
MPSPAVRVERVTKRFSGHTAVRDLSIEVPSGGIFGLLGPNGAGKSTTIRMIMDIIEPDEGTVSLFGSTERSRSLSGRVGYLPEERGLYKKMKVLEQLIFLGETKGISRSESRKRASAWLEKLGISDWAVKKVEDLSKGMQQKVQFAGALLHDPELVILDEPFSGLDPVNSQVMKDVVVEIARSGRTVLFSTHIMEQAERMCDHIVIIARGQKVVDGSVTQVKADFGGSFVALGFTHDKEKAMRVLADRRLVESVDDYGVSAEVKLAAGGDPEELLTSLVREGVGLRRFEVVEPSLQSIFIAKVGPEAGVAARSGDAALGGHT